MDRKHIKPRRREGAEEELLRDALSVIAHDLGSVTAALALRADVLASSTSASDAAALQGLTDELRDQGRLALLVRGPMGADALSPMRELPFNHWWRVVTHMTTAVLPRGIVVNATLGPGVLVSDQSHSYTVLWLAACKALAEEGVSAPCTIELVSVATPGSEAPGLMATCSRTAFPPRMQRHGRSRWRRYAERAAVEGGVTLGWWMSDGGRRIWSCAAVSGSATRARKD